MLGMFEKIKKAAMNQAVKKEIAELAKREEEEHDRDTQRKIDRLIAEASRDAKEVAARIFADSKAKNVEQEKLKILQQEHLLQIKKLQLKCLDICLIHNIISAIVDKRFKFTIGNWALKAPNPFPIEDLDDSEKEIINGIILKYASGHEMSWIWHSNCCPTLAKDYIRNYEDTRISATNIIDFVCNKYDGKHGIKVTYFETHTDRGNNYYTFDVLLTEVKE